MYDIVAGSKTVKSSYFLSKKYALELFPMLRGDKLVGGIVYYDGRYNISIKYFKNSYKLAWNTFYCDLLNSIRENESN